MNQTELQAHEDARIKFEEEFINAVSELTGMTYGDVQDMVGIEYWMYDVWITFSKPDGKYWASLFCEELDSKHPTRQ